MEHAIHKVAGVYPGRADAEAAARALREAGFEDAQVELVDRETVARAEASHDRIDADSVSSLIMGGVAGAGVGGAGAAALAAANVSVFVAAPIAAIGLGAALGAAAGGVASASLREPDFIALVKDALEHDYCVVVVNAHSEAQAIEAQDAIGHTAPEKTIDQYGSEQPPGNTRT
ncbi:MAG: hypothetical protein R3286_13010 [Gammaproteobacteria bacterium]|nr:hypothetical protein [Gammaproteobacteria bacterium]